MKPDIYEIIREAKMRRSAQNTQQFSDREYQQQLCDLLNAETVGVQDDYPCEYCGNKGVRYGLDNYGMLYSKRCPECDSIRKSIKLFNNSGLKNWTFDNFNASKDWQRTLLQAAKEYAGSGAANGCS